MDRTKEKYVDNAAFAEPKVHECLIIRWDTAKHQSESVGRWMLTSDERKIESIVPRDFRKVPFLLYESGGGLAMSRVP